MQTFLHEFDYILAAARLDNRRLVKQILETKQIHDAITGTTAWSRHPIVTMWTPWLGNLYEYGHAMCNEYLRRYETEHMYADFFFDRRGDLCQPDWLVERLVASHRAALCYKHPAHYRQFYPDVPAVLDYIWWHPELGFYRGQLSRPETVSLIEL